VDGCARTPSVENPLRPPKWRMDPALGRPGCLAGGRAVRLASERATHPVARRFWGRTIVPRSHGSACINEVAYIGWLDHVIL
jgi:hypothetical protein